MYTRTRRKKRTESMEATAGERETAEEDDDDDNSSQLLKERIAHQRRNLATTTPAASPSLSSLVVPVSDDNPSQSQRTSASHVARLLHEADLPDLIPLDWLDQIKHFLHERSHLLHQLDFTQTQFEKQYNSLKRRVDETETDNERLTAQHRSESKELLLYRYLVQASDSPNMKSKDYQQLKATIDTILKENEHLYAEIQSFKTSDPVYEQVQLLEATNQHLKDELIQVTHQNTRLKQLIELDEMKHLKSQLVQVNHEYEQLKLLNKKLIRQIQIHQRPIPTPSPPSASKQVRVYPRPPYSPGFQRPPPAINTFRASDDNLPALTIQNLRQFNITSRYPVPALPTTSSPEIVQLQDQVHLLEQKLHHREYELKTLQVEIEKGTSSIMSSIEDLYIASSSVSPTHHAPITNLPSNMLKTQPTMDELQDELDQLHDKLDEITRENQTLKNRTQEFDTIYEENEYLYAEKSHWNDEIERARIRELVLEQEIQSLKEREREFLLDTDSTTPPHTNPKQLKLKIDWLYQTNNQLELEVVRLREQLELLTHKYHDTKKDLILKDEHYKQLLTVAEDKQQLPQELTRLEKMKFEVESQLERERHEHEKIVARLEEQGEKREEKYSTLYETIIKLQSDYRQKESDYAQQMDELHQQLSSLRNQCEQWQQENKALNEEMKSKEEINRDLKLALTSSNNDTQAVYHQLRQLNTDLSDLQQKSTQDLVERDEQIELLHKEKQQLVTTYDGNLLKSNQIIIQLQHENKQHSHQIETYRSTLGKLQIALDEKQTFVEQAQSDLSERSALHVNNYNQLSQENKLRLTKINELEQALTHEQQRKTEFQRTIQDVQAELLKSRAVAKESLEKCQEFERRFLETDKHFEETIRTHLNETTEPTRRELTSLRAELVTKSDQITHLQHTLDDERLKRQRLEMKLKRLKDEYISVRKELYTRIEENNSLQHELVECRFKNDYNLHVTSQPFNTLKSPNENESSTAMQLYLKEKTENQHCQLKCRTYQQKFEQLQKNYESIKDKYKQRLHEEREIFERTKSKYLDHIKNVQNDLHETRQLLEKDTELKVNQESAYQQLIDERRQLLTSMVDKDAKVREMRRENLLLTSKIQLLEDQMENLNERVDRTLRERNQLRREINSVRLDTNLSIETSTRTSRSPTPTRATTYIETTAWNPSVQHADSFGFNNGHHPETSTVS